MKKYITFVLALVCMLTSFGCTSKNETDAGALPPMLTIHGENYFANTMPIDELPEGYECLGEITAEEANDTGLQGCKYYADKRISSFDEFYVYQECGTPIDEKTVDSAQRQWAYVKWVREGFDRE